MLIEIERDGEVVQCTSESIFTAQELYSALETVGVYGPCGSVPILGETMLEWAHRRGVIDMDSGVAWLLDGARSHAEARGSFDAAIEQLTILRDELCGEDEG